MEGVVVGGDVDEGLVAKCSSLSLMSKLSGGSKSPERRAPEAGESKDTDTRDCTRDTSREGGETNSSSMSSRSQSVSGGSPLLQGKRAAWGVGWGRRNQVRTPPHGPPRPGTNLPI